MRHANDQSGAAPATVSERSLRNTTVPRHGKVKAFTTLASPETGLKLLFGNPAVGGRRPVGVRLRVRHASMRCSLRDSFFLLTVERHVPKFQASYPGSQCPGPLPGILRAGFRRRHQPLCPGPALDGHH
ncbi:protein of unknown function [Pseudomonas sp. JV241A]|nr:protein of unknown function [Pseudomonas sp. JV241A]